MADGFVKLYRKLLKKPIWKKSTSDQRSILIATLLSVEWEPKAESWRGEKIELQPGQTITSLKKIAEASGEGITVKKVRTALERFENLEFLINETANGSGRLITITNWKQYQPDPPKKKEGKLSGRPRASFSENRASSGASFGARSEHTEEHLPATVSESGQESEGKPEGRLSGKAVPKNDENRASFRARSGDAPIEEIIKKKEKRMRAREDSPSDSFSKIPDQIDRIVSNLNRKTGQKFNPTLYTTQTAIVTLLQTYSEDEINSTVDFKIAEWLPSEKMRGNLNPNTLFKPEKFEAYFNQANLAKHQYVPPKRPSNEELHSNAQASQVIERRKRLLALAAGKDGLGAKRQAQARETKGGAI